jgi:uncharacterized protein with von Willebrand factor type A (vWA) domain
VARDKDDDYGFEDEAPRSKRKHTVQDTLGLKDDPRKRKLYPNSVRMNEIDRDIYHDCVDRYDAMATNLEDGQKEYAPFDTLSEDIFNSLYKYNADLRDEEDIQARSQFNHKLMSEAMESDEYQNLRKMTKFDMMSSAIATEVMQGQAMEKIQSFKEAYRQQQQTGQTTPGGDAGQLIDTLNKMNGVQSQIDALQGLKSAGHKLTRRQAMDLAALKQDYNDLVEEFENNTSGQQQLNQGARQAVSSATKSAAAEVTEVQDIVESWGLGSGDHSSKLPLDVRKKAIERVRRSGRLKGLTDLIGRFRAMALKKKKRPVKNGNTIKTITTGRKIEDTLPSERMKLGHPAMKRDFLRRMTQNQLLIYEREDQKAVGQGPLIVCQDKSGSTSGTIDDWSTALVLATLEIAQKEKRDFAYIPFDDKVLQTKDIQAGTLDPQDVLDIAEMPASGGTNFMLPLERALKALDDSRYAKADILFVTDGQAGVSPEFLERFKKKQQEKNFYVSTVLINIGGPASNAIVNTFSDSVTTISDLADLDEGSAAKIFNMIDDKSKFSTVPGHAAAGQPAAGTQAAGPDEDDEDEWEQP